MFDACKRSAVLHHAPLADLKLLSLCASRGVVKHVIRDGSDASSGADSSGGTITGVYLATRSPCYVLQLHDARIVQKDDPTLPGLAGSARICYSIIQYDGQVAATETTFVR